MKAADRSRVRYLHRGLAWDWEDPDWYGYSSQIFTVAPGLPLDHRLWPREPLRENPMERARLITCYPLDPPELVLPPEFC